jgi:hypothetical protein
MARAIRLRLPKWSIVWKECLTRTWRCQADGPRSGQRSIVSLLPRHSVISKADRRRPLVAQLAWRRIALRHQKVLVIGASAHHIRLIGS